MEYLDMYLVHWPVSLKPWVSDPLPNEEEFEKLDMETTWAGMERCMELGLCKGIGVSNFSCKKIQSLLDFASVTPAVNQVYTNVYEFDTIIRLYKLIRFEFINSKHDLQIVHSHFQVKHKKFLKQKSQTIWRIFRRKI